MIRKTLLFTAVAAACMMATFLGMGTAHATMRIAGDSGGLILDYAQRFLQLRTSGEAVVIDGACLSACTLAVAMLPRQQVCATPNAVLGFHAAWRPTARGGTATSAVATQAMMELYPSDVRSWISRHGGLTPRMIFLRGRELSALVPSCGGTDGVTTTAQASTAAHRGSYAAATGSLPRAKYASQQEQLRPRATKRIM